MAAPVSLQSKPRAPSYSRCPPHQPSAPGLRPPPGLALSSQGFLVHAWPAPLPASDLYSAVSSKRPLCLSLSPVPRHVISRSPHRLRVGLPCGPESQHPEPGGGHRHLESERMRIPPASPLCPALCHASPCLSAHQLSSPALSPLRPLPPNSPADLTHLLPGGPGAPIWPPGQLLLGSGCCQAWRRPAPGWGGWGIALRNKTLPMSHRGRWPPAGA